MSERIEPALTPEQWEQARGSATFGLNDPNDSAYLIAYHNAALPDTDPRKITRERIDHLRDMLGADESWTGCSPESFATAQAFLDALESYLPPE